MVTKDKTHVECYNLNPLSIPEEYWSQVDKGICPFCQGIKFTQMKIRGRPFRLLICEGCMRMYAVTSEWKKR